MYDDVKNVLMQVNMKPFYYFIIKLLFFENVFSSIYWYIQGIYIHTIQ